MGREDRALKSRSGATLVSRIFCWLLKLIFGVARVRLSARLLLLLLTLR